MSEEKIETKKKEKGVWKALGLAAVAVGGLAVTLAKELNQKKDKKWHSCKYPWLIFVV